MRKDHFTPGQITFGQFAAEDPGAVRRPVCAFSGHRNLSREEIASLGWRIAAGVEYLYGQGVRRFLCGGATGFDTLAAEQVILAGKKHPDIRLSLILPCRDQPKRWSEAEKTSYYKILSCANDVEYLRETYDETCMRLRNMRLVELADVLICYVTRYASGSGQTLRMMERKGGKIYNLAAASFSGAKDL